MKVKLMDSADGQVYFVVLANNNKVLVTSETYKTMQACIKGIKSLLSIASSEGVKLLNESRFEITEGII